MNQTDTKPWYKQFWPWFLIVLPGTVIVACLFTAYLAVHNPLSMVKKDYYQEGLTINKNLDELQRAKNLGLLAQVNFQRSNASIRIVLNASPVKGESFQNPDELELQLNHPVNDAKDLSFLLKRQADNSFVIGNINTEQWQLIENEKHWYIQLQASKNNAIDWAIQTETTHANTTTLVLNAARG